MELEYWQEEMLNNVNTVVKSTVITWGSLIKELGVNESLAAWVKIFETELTNLMSDIIGEVKDTKDNLINKIENLLKQSFQLHQQLSLDVPVYESDNLGLYKKESELLKQVSQLQKQVDLRLEELNALKLRQDEICRSLGETSQPIPTTPLPSANEIEIILRNIEQLEDKKFLREERFIKLKFDIMEMVKELNYKPALDFEKMVLSESDNNFTVTSTNMIMLEQFYESVCNQRAETKQEIAGLREELESLWDILEEDRLQCDQFLRMYPGNSLDTLDALKLEIKRCEDLKKANIQCFVIKIRAEIQSYWEKCGFTADRRDLFEYFTDDLYTQDLLTLHDIEKNKLKKYYEDNSELFNLLRKREELWSKLLELEELANAPDRLKNRGGKLLMEEKERNALSKRIPKIEDRLRELAQEYNEVNDTEFSYWGETIETIIQSAYENRDIEKKTKLSARKHKRELTVTPGKSCLSIASCGSMQNLRFTPMKPLTTNISNLPRSAKLTMTAPKPTTQKRMMNTPLYSASASKRNKGLSGAASASKAALPKSVPKILLNNKSITKTRVRYSTEKKKKMDRYRRISKLLKEQACNTENHSYESFEKELSKKEGGSSRSTVFASECPLTPLARPLSNTPYKTPRSVKTPLYRPTVTPRSTRLNSAKATPKLSTAAGFNFKL